MVFRKFVCSLLLGCIVTSGLAQTVSTDKPDYAPGDTVSITGAGFAPGESVQLQVVNLSDPSDNGPEHNPWIVTADANGNITTSWVVTSDEGGATLQLTAHGITSGRTAQTTFTDSSNVASITVGSASTDATYGTAQTITYVVIITANGNGNGSTTPAVSGLPVGVSGVFNPTTVNLRDVNNNPGNTTNITLTVTTVTNTGAVSNSFTITAQSRSTTGTLVVNPKVLTALGTLSAPSSKIYDGTTAAAVSGAASLLSTETFGSGSSTDGKPYAGDAVSLTGTAAYAYNSKDVSAATSITGSGLTLTGAQAINYTLTAPSFAASVSPRAVVLTGTRGYDGTSTAASTILSISNLVSGDTVSVASGNGNLANGNAGPHAIASFGTLTLANNAAGNYTLTGASGLVTIMQLSSAVSIASSKNPDGFNDGINFTAAVVSGATGNITFLANNAPFSTNTISGTNATSASISTLPRGTNTITAVYAGDVNYLGSTNSLSQVVTNHPPVVNTMTIARTAGLGCKFSLAELATNWSDIDGDTVTMSHLTAASTNGVTLVTNGNFIIYPGSANVSDQITYSVSDGHGGTNSGIVNITINAFVAGSQSAQMFFSSNSASLKFQGIPNYTYTIQRNTNLLSGLGWVSILTNTAASSNGVMNAVDNFSDLGHAPASAYYRLVWHP